MKTKQNKKRGRGINFGKDLIKISGKSNLPGKPNLYRTTREFLDYFGLSTLGDLPELPNVIDKNNSEEQELFTSIYKEDEDAIS